MPTNPRPVRLVCPACGFVLGWATARCCEGGVEVDVAAGVPFHYRVTVEGDRKSRDALQGRGRG